MADKIGMVGAFPPPPGHVPNFEHPTDLSRTSLIAVMAVMAGLTTVSFCLRTYSKLVLTVEYHLDDCKCRCYLVVARFYLITKTFEGSCLAAYVGLRWLFSRRDKADFSWSNRCC